MDFFFLGTPRGGRGFRFTAGWNAGVWGRVEYLLFLYFSSLFFAFLILFFSFLLLFFAFLILFLYFSYTFLRFKIQRKGGEKEKKRRRKGKEKEKKSEEKPEKSRRKEKRRPSFSPLERPGQSLHTAKRKDWHSGLSMP